MTVRLNAFRRAVACLHLPKCRHAQYRPTIAPHNSLVAEPRARTEFSLRAPPTFHWDTWCRVGAHVPHFNITAVVWVGGPALLRATETEAVAKVAAKYGQSIKGPPQWRSGVRGASFRHAGNIWTGGLQHRLIL